MKFKINYITITFLIILSSCEDPLQTSNKIIQSDDFQIAQEAYNIGEYKESIKLYTKIIDEYPEQTWLHMKRGDGYSQIEEYKNAVEDYKILLEAKTIDSIQAKLKIALAYFYSGNTDLSIESFKLLLTSLPKDEGLIKWSSYYHLGQLYYKKKDFLTALKYYDKADNIKLESEAIYHRANTLYSLGDTNLAVELYNKSIQEVKKSYVEINPESYLASCDTCGYRFNSTEYELLTYPDKSKHVFTMKKLKESGLIEKAIKNPEKYKDTTINIFRE